LTGIPRHGRNLRTFAKFFHDSDFPAQLYLLAGDLYQPKAYISAHNHLLIVFKAKISLEVISKPNSGIILNQPRKHKQGKNYPPLSGKAPETPGFLSQFLGPGKGQNAPTPTGSSVSEFSGTPRLAKPPY
jgi:hypothetical protein